MDWSDLEGWQVELEAQLQAIMTDNSSAQKIDICDFYASKHLTLPLLKNVAYR